MQTQKKRLPDPANSRKLTRMWADFVCIEKRMGKEVPFILGNSPNPDPSVFDACLGSGATSIGLKLSNVSNIFSNEIDADMQEIAEHEAKKYGVKLLVSGIDWRRLKHIMNRFDVVACLGNSLTLVFDRKEQLKVLRNFACLLNSTGVLMIDERNYPRILEGRFHQSGEFVYCGVDKVQCRPVEASDDLVRMEYEHLQTGDNAYLEMYPFKRGELRSLLAQAGFSDVRTFGDYKEDFDPKNVEFFTYVAKK